MGIAQIEDERYQILKFWWMLELFSPQKIPNLTSKIIPPPDRRTIDCKSNDPLPWDPESATQKQPDESGQVWRHTVYLGIYQLETTYESLGQIFGEDPDAYDKRPNGTSACAGLIVDQDGQLVPGSAVLSSALWAAGRTRNPGPKDPYWMLGFEQALADFNAAVDTFEGDRRDGSDEDSPLDADSLLKLLRLAHTHAGVSKFDDLASEFVVIDSVKVSTHRTEDNANTDFLNSFYLDDLAKVSVHVANNNFGAGLAKYLTSDDNLPKADRIDIVKHPESVDAKTMIEQLPKGRWPANPNHSLSLSQQFAVNRALNDLGSGAGLMGVNGPPGTGKTTMLRDILAGNVVERARRLASLSDPSEAFTKVTHRWNDSEGYPRRIRQLRPELTGFEMVVASANNAAVENITVEIPDQQAIEAPWRGEVDYFGQIATKILREAAISDASNNRTEPRTAWGLVAARLGRKRNRQGFYSAFWFDDRSIQVKKSVTDTIPRMQTRLTEWRDNKATYTPWKEACQNFLIREQHVETLIQQRKQAQDRLQQLSEVLAHKDVLESEINQQQRNIDQLQGELAQHQINLKQADVMHAEAINRYDRHRTAKPSGLEILFSFGRALREWRTALSVIIQKLNLAEQHSHRAHHHDQLRYETLSQAKLRLAAAKHDLKHVQAKLAQLQADCAQDKQRFGQAYPGPDWHGDARELQAPWLDKELDTARSDLFIAALQLHQDFLANTAADMLPGLRAACEVVAGKYPHNLESEKIHAAWQLFFLVVPLISTTFASLSRMFDRLGSQAIGWLLIDEAGQASPQYAVGAIWRARRIVAVGDPLQLEPIVTIPEKAQRNIASSYRVSSTWIAPRASVQTLADRITLLGTELDHVDDKVWISAPLRVHRRCDNPMFELCNQIAYNNLMVNGVHRDLSNPEKQDLFDSHIGPLITASYWLDVPADNPGSHLQLSQINQFKKILIELGAQGISPSEIIAISPFRAVADQLRNLSKNSYPGLQAGTIHTAQGRESNVVILVLGGDPTKPGAPANWAGSPNLVNVAASRAKRRLYVIGDRKFWARHNYFKDLANSLSSKTEVSPNLKIIGLE